MSQCPRSLFVLPFLLLAAPAHAQDADPPIDPQALEGDSLSIGVAVGVVPSYDGSDDEALAVMPLIRGRVAKVNFTLRGNRVWADLVPTDGGPGWDLQAGPIVSLNFNRSAAIKDPQVIALGRLDMAIELGGYVGLARQGVVTSDYDKLGVSVAYTYDVAGVSSSYVVTPSIDYGTPLSTKSFVGLNFSANYIGGGYADTYYGVTPAGAAASGLPAFDAGKGWKDWTLSAVGATSLTGDLTGGLSLIGGGSYRRMLNDAADSPITSIAGSRDQWIGMLGLAYTF